MQTCRQEGRQAGRHSPKSKDPAEQAGSCRKNHRVGAVSCGSTRGHKRPRGSSLQVFALQAPHDVRPSLTLRLSTFHLTNN